MTPTDKDLEAAKRFDQEYFGSMCEGDEFAKALAQFLTDYTAAKDTLIAELRKELETAGMALFRVRKQFSDVATEQSNRAEQAEAALAAMNNERDEAMNAGYAQGVENAEARAP